MEITYRIKTSDELREIFLSNAGSDVTYMSGINPFSIKLDGMLIYVYIKNISPAHLSNNNPDIWRIQLPVRKEFDEVKKSQNLFLLLGYDADNNVFTTWNPYWCKQRLNIGKSVSLYSRLSLQQNVSCNGNIEVLKLNNDSNVVCIPANKIVFYIKNIKEFYPTYSDYIPVNSSLQSKEPEMNNAQDVYKFFTEMLTKTGEFEDFLLNTGISTKSAKDYKRYIERLLNDGYFDRNSYLFLREELLGNYTNAFKSLLQVEDIPIIDKKWNGYIRASLNHFMDFLLYKAGIKQEPESITKTEIKEEDNYEVNEFGQLKKLDLTSKKMLAKYISGIEFPDYDKMLEVVNNYFPKKICDSMDLLDWMELFKQEDWKHLDSKGSKTTTRKKIQVTFPDGRVIKYNKVLDTLLEVVEYATPEKVETLNIVVCYYNMILREPLKDYEIACKPVKGGWYVNTATDTQTKYEQIFKISDSLNLGLKVELV